MTGAPAKVLLTYQPSKVKPVFVGVGKVTVPPFATVREAVSTFPPFASNLTVTWLPVSGVGLVAVHLAYRMVFCR